MSEKHFFFFFRVLKFLDQTSPPGIQDRMSLITEAYNKGRKTSVCSEEEFKCRGSDILIKKGLNNVKLF